MGKSDRCKSHSICFLTFFKRLGQITNEIKNNNARANVAPGTYERNLNDKMKVP